MEINRLKEEIRQVRDGAAYNHREYAREWRCRQRW